MINVEQVKQVGRFIGGRGGGGGSLPLTDFQTFNVQGLVVVRVNTLDRGVLPLCGPFFVSRPA